MNGVISVVFNDNFDAFWTNAKNIFADFNWTDAVDILILTFVFYYVTGFFRSRKAGTLIVGVIVLFLVYIFSVVFGFSAVEFILSGLFQIGVLAIVIIFQPELRDILETMGSGSIKSIRGIGDQSRKKQAQYKAIDNICKAVYIMSAEKTGALIAISRTTQLEEIIHSGTVINADVSDSLIRNIFYNKAPLHDGAMVIDGDKIVAAACILPLPRHTSVDSELGTRHRAAVGLSEVSDAVIIVVSEETGMISVAKESELFRRFTEDSLRKFLVKELVKDKREQE